MALERLDKILVKLGLGSRTEAKKMILSSRVKVNFNIITKSDIKIDSKKDIISIDDKIFDIKQYEYYIINKPKDCICARKDKFHKTVMSFIDDNRKDLVPVGRLDIDTEGLLLITDDGKLNHLLLSPKRHVPKTYFAKISGNLPSTAVDIFAKGMELDDGMTKPAKLEILSNSDSLTNVNLTIVEGRFHQVKRMFLNLSCKVEYLKRISFANLTLDEAELPLGSYRRLNDNELEKLKSFVE